MTASRRVARARCATWAQESRPPQPGRQLVPRLRTSGSESPTCTLVRPGSRARRAVHSSTTRSNVHDAAPPYLHPDEVACVARAGQHHRHVIEPNAAAVRRRADAEGSSSRRPPRRRVQQDWHRTRDGVAVFPGVELHAVHHHVSQWGLAQAGGPSSGRDERAARMREIKTLSCSKSGKRPLATVPSRPDSARRGRSGGAVFGADENYLEEQQRLALVSSGVDLHPLRRRIRTTRAAPPPASTPDSHPTPRFFSFVIWPADSRTARHFGFASWRAGT